MHVSVEGAELFYSTHGNGPLCLYTVPYVLWDGIANILPSATLQIFDESGHQPFFEEPDRFVAALTDWMTSRC